MQLIFDVLFECQTLSHLPLPKMYCICDITGFLIDGTVCTIYLQTVRKRTTERSASSWCYK